jgi:hypothetical protein
MSLHNSMVKKIVRDKTLSGSQVGVLLLLHRICGKENFIETTQAQLSENSQYDKSTISRSLDSLIKKGYIKNKDNIITVKESLFSNNSEDYRKEGFIDLSSTYFTKLLKCKKIRKSGIGLRLALHLALCLSANKKKKDMGNMVSPKIILNLSIPLRCDERQIERSIKLLKSLKIITYNRIKNKSIIQASAKILNPAIEQGNDYRNKYIVEGITRKHIKNPPKTEIKDTAHLLTQYKDKIELVKKTTFLYVSKNKKLCAEAIHRIILARLKNPSLIVSD